MDGSSLDLVGDTSTCAICQDGCNSNSSCDTWSWDGGPRSAYDDSSACVLANATCRWFMDDGTPMATSGDTGNCSACQDSCSQNSDCGQYSWQGGNLTQYDDGFPCTGVHSSPPATDYPPEPPAPGESKSLQCCA